jgi:hypothetical protein
MLIGIHILNRNSAKSQMNAAVSPERFVSRAGRRGMGKLSEFRPLQMAFRQNHGISVLLAGALCRSCFYNYESGDFWGLLPQPSASNQSRPHNVINSMSFSLPRRRNRFRNARIFARQRFCRDGNFQIGVPLSFWQDF